MNMLINFSFQSFATTNIRQPKSAPAVNENDSANNDVTLRFNVISKILSKI